MESGILLFSFKRIPKKKSFNDYPFMFLCACVFDSATFFFVSFPIVYEGNPVPRKNKNKAKKNESAGTYQEHMNDMKSYYREIYL